MPEANSKAVFEAAVIGAGLFGSAAARYLSAAGLQTLILGPDEPANKYEHQGVFASHYDEARITRIVDYDPVWGELAARSIAEYSCLEEQSGICFHHAVGCLRVAPLQPRGESGQQHCVENGTAQNAVFEVLSAAETARQFPEFHFSFPADAIWERGAAGYINPRRMLAAQLTIAQKQSATLSRETVQEIISQRDAVTIVTREGHTYRADKVLLAAGAYTDFLVGRSAGLRVNLIQALLAEVEEPRTAMPCLIYSLPNHPTLKDIYLLPPIRYSDGKWYLKIGAFSHHLPIVESEKELRRWFQREPDDEETHATKRVLRELMPHLKILSLHAMPCVRTCTPSMRPYVQPLESEESYGRIFIATGGCGLGAKSSDAIGRMGAELLLNAA